MSTIKRAIQESINYDRIVAVTVYDSAPLDVFGDAKDASPDFDEDGNELAEMSGINSMPDLRAIKHSDGVTNPVRHRYIQE